MNLQLIFLQLGGGEGQGGNPVPMIFMIVAMVAIFYFFMIRPQQKRQKELQQSREAMKTGDKVIVAGGIHGRIKDIAETSMIVEIDEGVRIRVDKASVYASSESLQGKP